MVSAENPSSSPLLPAFPLMRLNSQNSLKTSSSNPFLIYLSSLGKGSRRTMSQSLKYIAELCGSQDPLEMAWENLRYSHTQAIRAKLLERYAPNTTNKMLAGLRGVLKECWRLELMTAEEYHRAVELQQVKNTALPRGRLILREELEKLFLVCKDGSKAGVRDLAILAILFGCGLRRSEVTQLELKDYDKNHQELRILGSKGNKDRIAYLPEKTDEAIKEWLQVREGGKGSLFCRIRKGDHLEYCALTSQAIYFILKMRAESAGIQEISPHDSRRTYISNLLEKGVDVMVVQKMAGHANLNTTLRYDRRNEGVRKKAAQGIDLPF